MEETLDLKEILEVLKKNLILIIALAFLFGGIAASATAFLMTPQYRATTQILVSQSEQIEMYMNQEIEASLNLINTYSEIITSPVILNEVAGNLGSDYSNGALAGQVTVSNQNDSQVIHISVEDEVANSAESIANEIASVFQSNIPDIMNVNNVSILSIADIGENPSPVSPQPLVNTAIGVILGTLLSLGIAFLREFLKNDSKPENEIKTRISSLS